MPDIKSSAEPPKHAPAARPKFGTIIASVVGAFTGILLLNQLGGLLAAGFHSPMVIGSFGASAVLLFGAPNSPLAQPYNLVVGHVLSALIGIAAFQIVGETNGLSMALAVSLAIGAMQLTRSVHPPGGASALVAVIGSQQIHDLGFLYAFFPVGVGALILLFAALLANNLLRRGPWPLFWIPFALPGRKAALSKPGES